MELTQPLQELPTFGRGGSSRQVVNLALQVAEVFVAIVTRGVKIADLAQRGRPADLAMVPSSPSWPYMTLKRQ